MAGRPLATRRAAVSLHGVRIEKLSATWPDRLLALAYVRRAAAFWAAIHIFLWIVGNGAIMSLAPLPAVTLVGIAGGLGVFDAMKRDELLFLRNLGVHPAMVAVIWIGVAALLELSAHLAVSVWR